jgi:hypothetical protein
MSNFHPLLLTNTKIYCILAVINNNQLLCTPPPRSLCPQALLHIIHSYMLFIIKREKDIFKYNSLDRINNGNYLTDLPIIPKGPNFYYILWVFS